MLLCLELETAQIDKKHTPLYTRAQGINPIQLPRGSGVFQSTFKCPLLPGALSLQQWPFLGRKMTSPGDMILVSGSATHASKRNGGWRNTTACGNQAKPWLQVPKPRPDTGYPSLGSGLYASLVVISHAEY